MSDDDIHVTKKRAKAGKVMEDDDESAPKPQNKAAEGSLPNAQVAAQSAANASSAPKTDDAAKRKRKVITDDDAEESPSASVAVKPAVVRAGADEEDDQAVKKASQQKRKAPPARSADSDESEFDADDASDEVEEEQSSSGSNSSASNSDDESDSDSDSGSRRRKAKAKQKKAPTRAPVTRRIPTRRGAAREEEDWENIKAAATSSRRAAANRGKAQAVVVATAKAATRNDPSMRRIGLGLRNRKDVPYQKMATGNQLPDDEDSEESEEPAPKKKAPPKKAPPKKRTADSSDSEGSEDDADSSESNEDDADEEENGASGSNEDDGDDAEKPQQRPLNLDEFEQPEPAEKSVEKLLAVRDSPSGQEVLVKWKNTSYMHLDWVPAKSLEGDKHTKQRLIKFLRNPPLGDSEDAFDQCYLEVDRIIAREKRHGVMKYLVKWNGLPYSEATWELPEDIKEDTKVHQFERWNTMPDPADLKLPPRPPASAWQKLEASHIYKNENTLRPYQLEGFNWLTFCWFNRRNSILADEMGLGKTVQSVSILEYLHRIQKIRGPFLIIAPLSTIPHWKREFENWTEMNAIVYHGNAESRALLRTYEFFFRDNDGRFVSKTVPKFNALITTYEVVMQDRSALSKLNWRYLVVDEAHRLKNKNSRLLNELKLYKFDHLLLLTGTPLQNNTEELWTLLNFLEENEFASLEDFLVEFGDLKEHSQVEKLQSVLAPYMLRRMKDDVEKSIAPKEETIVEVELTAIQREYYKAIYDKNLGLLVKGTKGGNTGSMMNIMLQLRKCCNHPFLLKGVEQSVLDSLPNKSPKTANDALVKASGKMVLVDKLLPKLKAGGHKVLIFSQWVRILDILEDYLHHKGYLYERIDGGVRGNDRQASIDRFSKPDSDRFVFLLCTRAGGLGINLTAADTVIIFDSDWNPQNDLQAQARCHRIGQKQLVKVYRLITRGTYEAQMFERSSKKLGLDQAVLHTINKKANAASAEDDKPQLSKKEIDALLKYGAYDIFREGNENTGTAYDERDIDQILERNSRTVVHTATGRDEQGVLSTFAKATFTPAAPTVDPTDPDFWAKLFPNRPLTDPNIIDEPRARRKTERYGTAQERGDLASDDDDAGAADVDFEEEPETAADAEMSKDAPGNRRRSGWLNAERMRFKIALVRLGYGRWRAIKHSARLWRWTAAQVRLYAEAWMKKIAKVLEVDEDVAFSTVRNASPDEEREDERRDREEHPPTDKEKEKDPRAIAMPSVPAAHATALLQQQQAAEGGEGHAAPAGEMPLASITDFTNDPSLTDPKFEEYITRNAKQIYRRLQTLAQLGEFVRPHKTPAELPLTDEMLAGATDAPAPWWTLADDKALLFGCVAHGFGEWDAISRDKALGFADRIRLDGDKDDPAASTKLAWPAPGQLGARLRRLLKALHALRRNELKQQRLREKQNKEEAKQKKRATLEQDWSKREKFDFFRALTTFGVPLTENGEYDWEFIKTKANLKRKSAELIEKYYIEFLKICREIISSPPSEAKVKGADAKNVKKEKVIQNERLPEITYSQCRRMVMRITLFSSIRTKVLPHPELRQIVNRASIGAAMPSWWRHEHDAGLLQGVSKYGFGNWEEMCADPNLPFLEVATRLRALRPIPKAELQLAPVGDGPAAPAAAAAASSSAPPSSPAAADTKPLVVDKEKEQEKEKEKEKDADGDEDDEIDLDKPPGEKDGAKDSAEAKAKKEKEKENLLTTALKFPKDKIIAKRLDTLVTLFTKPLAQVSSTPSSSAGATSVPKGSKQTSIYSFSQKGVKPADDGASESKAPKAKREKLDPAAKKEKAERRKAVGGEKPLKPKKFSTDVPRNPDGSIRFPIVLGAMNVHSLGTVVHDRPNWHTDKYIYPAGFKTSRAYASLTQPEGRCLYYSEIVDDGKDPKFVVTAETGQSFSAPSATSAWVQVLKAVADVKKEKRETVSISGPEYFGFANPTIHKLVQELPNANKCNRYKMVDYAAKAAEAEAAEQRMREERDKGRPGDISAMISKSQPSAVAPGPKPPAAQNGSAPSLLSREDSNPAAKKRKSADEQPPSDRPTKPPVPQSGPSAAPPTASKSAPVQTKLPFGPTSKADLRHILGDDLPN